MAQYASTHALNGEPKSHFVNADEKTRDFYRVCSVQEYYHRFARERLKYATNIRRIMERWPDARYVLVSQRRLANDARVVVSRLHYLMKHQADENYLESLPVEHASFGDVASSKSKLPANILAELNDNDQAMLRLIDSLPVNSNLTTRQPLF